MKIFYRLSDGSYPKVRFENATKDGCLQNFLKHFNNVDDEMFLYLDNVKDATFEKYVRRNEFQNTQRSEKSWARQSITTPITIVRTNKGSSAASFREVLTVALGFDDDEVVYFVEDDYAHLWDSRRVLLEGIERADYVTLYNHPDKYLPASRGGNPLIGDDAAEATKVFVTDNSYWMMTNSTTMTFATTVKIIREDKDVWFKFTDGSYPHDMQIFLELREKGRTLVQPIPTKSTHCEPAWAAHLHGTGVHDWNEYLEALEYKEPVTLHQHMNREGQ